MKQYIKRTVQILMAFFLTFFVTLVASNKEEIENYINKYSHFSLQWEDISFFNWQQKENVFISDNDPQIIVSALNEYINNLYINVEIFESQASDEIIVYYTEADDDSFTSEKSVKLNVDKSNGKIEIDLNKNVQDLRIDLSEQAGTQMVFKNIIINSYNLHFAPSDILLWLIMLIGISVIFYFRRFLVDLYKERELICTLVKNDLKSRYAGSFFGLVWAFVQPCMTIIVFWVVYELGFRFSPVNNVKYILWFVPAYIPWFYFSDAVVNAANSLREYSYLVKKMKFPVEILPAVKVFSSLIIHLFFIGFMVIIYAFYRYGFSLMSLQILYYLIALICLLLGIAWLTSAISVFMKDFSQIISILLQLAFFMIPIFWNDADMSSKVLMFLKLNPAFYIVQGYRDSMINGIFFWDRPILTAYYWGITIIVFAAGVRMFNKLRKHFADLI